MQLCDILTEDRTQANIAISSKKKAMEALAECFAQSIPTLISDEIYHQFVCREKLGTTGIGDGIAIPHCRFDTDGKTFAACFTLKEPIDFDAVDNQPVDLIIAMLVPHNAESSHLQTLSNLAQKLQASDYAEALRRAETNKALFFSAIE